MAVLKIGNPGEIRLLINNDPSRVLAFNPEDVSFANRFYEVYEYLTARQEHYEKLDAEVSALPEDAKDEHGFDLRGIRRMRGQLEMCMDMRKAIDTLFGEGTSQMAFGDVNVPGQFMQLLSGVMPFLSDARTKKGEKYMKEGGGLPPSSARNSAKRNEAHGGKRVPGGHSGEAASGPQWEALRASGAIATEATIKLNRSRGAGTARGGADQKGGVMK